MYDLAMVIRRFETSSSEAIRESRRQMSACRRKYSGFGIGRGPQLIPCNATPFGTVPDERPPCWFFLPLPAPVEGIRKATILDWAVRLLGPGARAAQWAIPMASSNARRTSGGW